MRIVLVAKPWRGGLASYLYRALQEMVPGEVEWWPTRPVTRSERLAFSLDKRRWFARLKEKIERDDSELQLFINYPRELSVPASSRNRILWLTDGPQPRSGDLDNFAKIFLSDRGYAAGVLNSIPAKAYGGELPFACSPDLHRPYPGGSEAKSGCCFIGNRDRKRDRYLSTLFDCGLGPLVVGNYFGQHYLFWRHPLRFRPTVPNEAMGRIYGKHLISLNLHAEVVRKGTNMRTFECAGYGIGQLVEYRPGLERFFDIERELVTFRDEKQLMDHMRELQLSPERVATISARARARVLAEHSYHHRVAQLLDGVIPDGVLHHRLQKAQKRWLQNGTFP